MKRGTSKQAPCRSERRKCRRGAREREKSARRAARRGAWEAAEGRCHGTAAVQRARSLAAGQRDEDVRMWKRGARDSRRLMRMVPVLRCSRRWALAVRVLASRLCLVVPDARRRLLTYARLGARLARRTTAPASFARRHTPPPPTTAPLHSTTRSQPRPPCRPSPDAPPSAPPRASAPPRSLADGTPP
jgi:hypothetical protein